MGCFSKDQAPSWLPSLHYPCRANRVRDPRPGRHSLCATPIVPVAVPAGQSVSRKPIGNPKVGRGKGILRQGRALEESIPGPADRPVRSIRFAPAMTEPAAATRHLRKRKKITLEVARWGERVSDPPGSRKGLRRGSQACQSRDNGRTERPRKLRPPLISTRGRTANETKTGRCGNCQRWDKSIGREGRRSKSLGDASSPFPNHSHYSQWIPRRQMGFRNSSLENPRRRCRRADGNAGVDLAARFRANSPNTVVMEIWSYRAYAR